MISITLNKSEAVSLASFSNLVGGKGEHVELLKAVHLNFTASETGGHGSLVAMATDRHVAVRQTLAVEGDTSFAINLGAGIQKFLKGVKNYVTLAVDGTSITATSEGSSITEESVSGVYPVKDSIEPMFESAVESMTPVPSLNLDLNLLVKVSKLIPVDASNINPVYGVYTQGERESGSKLPLPVLLVRDGLQVLVMPMMNR
jgi:hypothetical protein